LAMFLTGWFFQPLYLWFYVLLHDLAFSC
jgi:hypothetical protein